MRSITVDKAYEALQEGTMNNRLWYEDEEVEDILATNSNVHYDLVLHWGSLQVDAETELEYD